MARHAHGRRDSDGLSRRDTIRWIAGTALACALVITAMALLAAFTEHPKVHWTPKPTIHVTAEPLLTPDPGEELTFTPEPQDSGS